MVFIPGFINCSKCFNVLAAKAELFLMPSICSGVLITIAIGQRYLALLIVFAKSKISFENII